MPSAMELQINRIDKALKNLYSIMLSSRELTRQQEQATIKFLSYYETENEPIKTDKLLAKTSNKNILDSVKNTISNIDISRQMQKYHDQIKKQKRKLKILWFIFSISLVILVSIVYGVYFTQTQYKKAGYNSLGKVMVEERVKK